MHEGHHSEFKGGTVESSRGRRPTRTRPQDRGGRDCSPPEGHQSADEDGESKKKVDWYDAQLAEDAGMSDMDGAITGGSGSRLSPTQFMHASLIKPCLSAPQKSMLRPPKLAPSAWQFYFADFIEKAQANTTEKLNVAQAAMVACQEYANLNAAEKEVRFFNLICVSLIFDPSSPLFRNTNAWHRLPKMPGRRSSPLTCLPSLQRLPSGRPLSGPPNARPEDRECLT